MVKFFVLSILLIFVNTSQAKVYFKNSANDSFQQQYNLFIKDENNIHEKNHTSIEKFFLGYIYFKGISSENSRVEYTIEPDIKRGIDYLLAAWNENVTNAGYALAMIYYHGEAVEKNIELSKQYLTATAEQGYAQAQTELGTAYWGESYKFKEVVQPDVKKAEYWLMKAADQGYAEPAAILSRLYLSLGRNIEAFKYTKKAMNPTDGDLRTNYPGMLAEMYENGTGTKVDLVLAYKYYDLLGTAGGKGKNRIAKDMTDAEIQEAIKQSRAWQEEHRTFVPSYYGLQHQSDGSYR